jgi:riboflavin biosynthesis pyrimidine reductase
VKPGTLAPRALETAQDVRALARRLWGEVPCGDGVVHVTAVAAPPDASLDRLSTLAIDAESPKSDYDAFALSFARAGADAILITGQILRAEPELRYSLGALGLPASALEAYRRETGRREPPALYVLTSGRGLDPSHPALHGWPRAHLVVPEDASLPDAELRSAGIVVEREAAPSLRKLVARLRDCGGLKRVLIEAGPNTSGDLYDAPARIDELLLSVYRGRAPARLVGALAPGAASLVPRAAPSQLGDWSFQLLRRTGSLDPTVTV